MKTFLNNYVPLLFSLLFLTLTGYYCQLDNIVEQDNTVISFGNEAVSGIQQLYPQGSQISRNDQSNTAIGNRAKSVQRIANSGSRLISGRGFQIGEDLNISTNAQENIAVSNQDNAVSGSQTVLDTVQDASVSEQSVTNSNEASVVGVQGGYPTALSGSQTLATSINNSQVFLGHSASQNIASNDFNGKAISGIDQSVGNVLDSLVVQENVAVDNFAEAENGPSVAGVRTSAANVTDSSIYSYHYSIDNQAEATGNNAIAGTESIFGSISGTRPGGSSFVATNSVANHNLAVAEDGKGIAGVGIRAEKIDHSVLDSNAQATYNKAVSKGEGDLPQTSIAGVDVTIKDVIQSTVKLNTTSQNNQAFNYHEDPTNSSDAVAGLQVVVGSADRSVIAVIANSSDNFAYAKHGDAIAGNKIFVNDSSSDTFVTAKLEAANNKAYADNGEAIVYNDISVNGDARMIFG
eukprot:TRINITY_DN442_c0_g1_i6.p1 TRINITY_DN442_c0_g1~~TRINITY_DN442_c0_g1_i6.p1  ORF type:complete len:463 (-),score=74.37 TRINITY_DN442_c0_g1_i6:165-1553(-)